LLVFFFFFFFGQDAALIKSGEGTSYKRDHKEKDNYKAIPNFNKQDPKKDRKKAIGSSITGGMQRTPASAFSIGSGDETTWLREEEVCRRESFEEPPSGGRTNTGKLRRREEQPPDGHHGRRPDLGHRECSPASSINNTLPLPSFRSAAEHAAPLPPLATMAGRRKFLRTPTPPAKMTIDHSLIEGDNGPPHRS
jgi:hypothetical protein